MEIYKAALITTAWPTEPERAEYFFTQEAAAAFAISEGYTDCYVNSDSWIYERRDSGDLYEIKRIKVRVK
jgi:hypothetical protein